MKSIRIGAIPYKITNTENLRSPDDDRKLDGMITFTNQTIQLNQNLTPAVQRVILWHEILHGIAVHAGLDIEEELATALGYGIFQVLQDNPTMGRLIEEDTNKRDEAMAYEKCSISSNERSVK